MTQILIVDDSTPVIVLTTRDDPSSRTAATQVPLIRATLAEAK